MKVYKELKQICDLNKQIRDLIDVVDDEIDADGLDLVNAYLIEGCTEKNGHLYNCEGKRLDNCGLVDDSYYCNQHTGYLEDDFWGTLYFATEQKGVFVKVPFEC